MDGDLPNIRCPIGPGREIIGRIVERGRAVREFQLGDRVGVPWLGRTCGHCAFCLAGRENLCAQAQFTGYTLDGGYAQFACADARYCLPSPCDIPTWRRRRSCVPA
jgi:alcohol dehydrogenase, propanol-preferring